MIWDGMLEDARYGYLVFKEQNTIPQTGNSGRANFQYTGFRQKRKPYFKLPEFSKAAKPAQLLDSEHLG
jgi:hypothetical protein